MADPWIRVHADLAGKPVIMRAAESLGINAHEAMGLLVQFWGAVSRHVTDGRVGGHSDATLESWAGWHRTRGRFAKWIRASHLDVDGRVNEWDDYAGKLELRRATERNRLRDKRTYARQLLQDVAQQPPNNSDDVAQPLQDVGPRARERNETRRDDTRTTTTTARANGPGIAGLAERLSEVDRAALGELLGVVPSPATWIADLTASLDGMPGHTLATPAQLGEAIRDYLGNGASTNPNLRQMRRYIESAVHPMHPWPLGSTRSTIPAPGPKGGSARNDAAIDAWAARQEAEHGKH